MITCHFYGGLGNNLFQLAAVYAISKTSGFELSVPISVNRGNIKQYGQEPSLEIHNLFENKFIKTEVANLRDYYHPDMNAAATDFTHTPVPCIDNTRYHGYFQSDKYFLNVEINKEFILNKAHCENTKLRYQHLFNKKTIAMHYRLGGDRVLPDMQHYHKNVSVDFYIKSVELIGDYTPDTHNILVCTDNVTECKKILQNFPYPFIMIEQTDNITDFILMSLCDVNIIGNSTFSWWAAYMNQKPHKKVLVSETEWVGPGYSHFNLKDMFPESWIRL